MTDEAKGDGMTLDKWLDVLREMDGELYPSGVEALADSIERHLAAQSAMRVDEDRVSFTDDELYQLWSQFDESSAPEHKSDIDRIISAKLKRAMDKRAALQAAIGGKE